MLKIQIRSYQNLLFGLFLSLFGVAGLVEGRELDIGQTLRMGPGYFPTILCAAIVILGLGITLSSFVLHESRPEPWAWQPMAIVVAAIALFGFLIERAGLVLATSAVVLFATFAVKDRKWVQAGLLAVGLSFLCVIVFRILLGLLLPIWPA